MDLEALLAGHDHHAALRAVAAVFERDARGAFDFFAKRFDAGRLGDAKGAIVAERVLSFFAPFAFSAEGPIWRDVRARAWLAEDERWCALFVRLRRHPLLGQSARDVLRYAQADQVRRALAQAEPAPVIAPRMATDGTLLERYRRGEHVAVWNELRAPAAIEGAFRDEALAVARETMRRVRHNLDLLCARLVDAGWERAVDSVCALRTPPTRADDAIMAEMESVTGAPLAPSLRAFWEIVGGVDLAGEYRSGSAIADMGLATELPMLDPLQIDSAATCAYLLDEWHDSHAGIDPEIADPCRLDLGADALHKAGVSGGPPYGVELPFLGADPPLVNEPHRLSFVDYLRLSLRWAGFPRLPQQPASPELRTFVARMTDGFVEL